MSTILPFKSNPFPTLEQVGGKALALMEMSRAGFPVPPGFVLTVAFFEPWFAALQQSPAWQALSDAGIEAIGETAKTLQGLCDGLVFTQRQRAGLQAAMQDLGTGLLAVRSSSPEEDTADASFAGGYETTLGVNPEAIEAAIRHSFRSSFDQRVFLYKKERGFRLDQSRIAVIVQQQINAESAGVAFSLNPLNNCYDEVVINANVGLGESVVSGEAEPDLFVVDKITNEIITAQMGRKQTVIVLDEAGGTKKVAGYKANQTAITPAQALELTNLVKRVETHYEHPTDIEWAMADGQIFLLQARPITTYLPLPADMLTAPGEPKRLYANSTLIEQGLQEPLSVLGTDFMSYVLNKVGGPVAEGAIGIDGLTFTATGGYYMNVSYAYMMGMQNAGLAPGSFGDPRLLEMLDNIDMREYTRGKLPPKLKALRGRMVFKMLPMVLGIARTTFGPRRVLAQYQAALPEELHRLATFDGTGLTLHEQAVALTNQLAFFYGDYGIPMILAGQIAQRRIQNLFKDDADTRDHLVNLGVALPGNKTAEMGELLYELATADELLRYDDATSFLWDIERGVLSPEFTQRWKRFLSEFGMRCPGEVDPATPRPRENPAPIFRQLKAMSLSIHERASEQSYFEASRIKREMAYQALHTIAMKKGTRVAKTFTKLYDTWLVLGGYRETPKHYIITVVDLFRCRALEIARHFVDADRLDTPEQIFDLTIADIDRALADTTLDLRILAQDHAVLIHKIRKNKLTARLLDSRGKVFYPPRKAAKDGELSGVPISPGVVQGRVKVLQTADEKPLLPGEILVARATDPGWTPLFINAAGIILEIGGALQHGAVVAREYGTPCVSGVDDATNLLQDGQLVEVDGSNGVVRVLDGDIPIFRPISESEREKQQEIATQREKAQARQKRRQAIRRIIPLLFLPLIPLILFVGVFVIIQLGMGHSIEQIRIQLADLWQVSFPYLNALTTIIGVPILAFTIWNSGVVKKLAGRQKKS